MRIFVLRILIFDCFAKGPFFKKSAHCNNREDHNGRKGAVAYLLVDVSDTQCHVAIEKVNFRYFTEKMSKTLRSLFQFRDVTIILYQTDCPINWTLDTKFLNFIGASLI